jgi:TMEM175 potassium channel family protein
MSEGPKPSTPLDLGAGRLEAFSDAVMAVIITILALELRPPDGSSFAAVKDALPNLLIYVLSFLFIAIYWNNHHHLLRATTRISGGVMWANMFLLFWLSLIPVVTAWLHNERVVADQIDHFYRDPIPVASFGLVALAAAVAYTLLVRAIIRANGRDSMVAVAISSDVKGLISLAMYLVGVVFAFAAWVRPAYFLYAAVAVMWLIPDRRFTRVSNV